MIGFLRGDLEQLIAGIIRQVNPYHPTDAAGRPSYATCNQRRCQWRMAAGLRLIQFLDPQERTMKTLLAFLMSSVFVVLTGCNTVAGAGKDIERGGEKVQDTAKDVQQKL
jgi:predicted small secreted protein